MWTSQPVSKLVSLSGRLCKLLYPSIVPCGCWFKRFGSLDYVGRHPEWPKRNLWKSYMLKEVVQSAYFGLKPAPLFTNIFLENNMVWQNGNRIYRPQTLARRFVFIECFIGPPGLKLIKKIIRREPTLSPPCSVNSLYGNLKGLKCLLMGRR